MHTCRPLRSVAGMGAIADTVTMDKEVGQDQSRVVASHEPSSGMLVKLCGKWHEASPTAVDPLRTSPKSNTLICSGSTQQSLSQLGP